MKINKDNARLIALTLQQQARRNREKVSPDSAVAEMLERAAAAPKRGEGLQQ